MIKPSLEEINSLAQSYKIIPVTKEIYADTTTPITLLRKISAISNRFYLAAADGKTGKRVFEKLYIT